VLYILYFYVTGVTVEQQIDLAVVKELITEEEAIN
jgi:hypothetical protein